MQTATELSSLRVKELTEICKKLGIRSSGKKADLVERLASSSAYQQSFHHMPTKHGYAPTAAARTSSNGSTRPSALAKRSANAELASSRAKKQRYDQQQVVNAIHLVFDTFRDHNDDDDDSSDAITDDGIIAFCDALGIDTQDPVILVFSYLMNAAAMSEFTRSEFTRGFEALGCVSIADLRAKLPLLRAKLHNPTEFAAIYAFTFGFAKDPTQKSLALEIATGLWELLLPTYFPLLPHWLAFVKTNCRNSISKDVWLQVLDFAKQIKPDLSNFDENGAWPVLIDDFVTHLQDAFAARGIDAVLAEVPSSGPAAMAIDS